MSPASTRGDVLPRRVNGPPPSLLHGSSPRMRQMTLSRRKNSAAGTTSCLKRFCLMKRQHRGNHHPVPAQYRNVQTVPCWVAHRLNIVISTTFLGSIPLLDSCGPYSDPENEPWNFFLGLRSLNTCTTSFLNFIFSGANTTAPQQDQQREGWVL